MPDLMLIDAVHSEETRIVVMHNNRIEDFDLETENKRPLRDNIYLAQITRIEPSLQAAFVEYGGNRRGFLAFSEIHPDFYQIPIQDREELLREYAKEGDTEQEGNNIPEESENDSSRQTDDKPIEDIGNDTREETTEHHRIKKTNLLKKYKIQEVIKRRQVILVQVVKEERGNKGVALTTYLSLAGRYCILMPNTSRGEGGISRRITNQKDRQKLKKIVTEMNIEDNMGLIIRTAGSDRSKLEIKRDYEYLLRSWEKLRNITLKSIAPTLVYESGSLIKRSIRDLYNKDFEQILIEGDTAYKNAKEYMKMLIPSHARKIKLYKDNTPIFQSNGIEEQLATMFSPIVTMPSGGYIVINQTEALVAIDVNSGKFTKEHSIEKTALKTNLEAATEIARQMRLRDLAGLIVIDFIDMEEKQNNYAVERKLKEALKSDRSKIQIGRISHFGLLEMSRQRMRTGFLEGSSNHCNHCNGTGMIRSIDSCSLHILRLLKQESLKDRTHQQITVKVAPKIATYILNQKRASLSEIEKESPYQIVINADDTLGIMQMIFCDSQNPAHDKIISMDGTSDDTVKTKKKSNARHNNMQNTPKNKNKKSTVKNKKNNPISKNSHKIKTTETEKKGKKISDIPRKESPSDIPRKESPSDIPRKESPSDIPRKKSPSDIPRKESPSDIPRKKSPSDIPRKKSPSDIPRKESPSDIPRKESPSDIPRKESPSDIPQKESPSDIPQKESPMETKSNSNIEHPSTKSNIDTHTNKEEKNTKQKKSGWWKR